MSTRVGKRIVWFLSVVVLLAFAPGVTHAEEEDDNTLLLDCTDATVCFSDEPVLTESRSPTFNIRFEGDPTLPSQFASTTVAIMVPDTVAGAGDLNFFVNMDGTIVSAVDEGFWTAADPVDHRLLTDFLGLNVIFEGVGRNPELADFLALVDGATGFHVYLATVDFWVDNMPISFCTDSGCSSAFDFFPGTWFYAFTQNDNEEVVDGVPSPSANILIVPEPGTFSLLSVGLAFLYWTRRRLGLEQTPNNS